MPKKNPQFYWLLLNGKLAYEFYKIEVTLFDKKPSCVVQLKLYVIVVCCHLLGQRVPMRVKAMIKLLSLT